MQPPKNKEELNLNLNLSPLVKADEEYEAVQVQQLEKEYEEPDGVGIGLSGGGIRSASFCSGAVTSILAGNRFPEGREIKHISSVSGGGYFAAAVAQRLSTNQELGVNDAVKDTVKEFNSRPGHCVSCDTGGRDACRDILWLALVLILWLILFICTTVPWMILGAEFVELILGPALRVVDSNPNRSCLSSCNIVGVSFAANITANNGSGLSSNDIAALVTGSLFAAGLFFWVVAFVIAWCMGRCQKELKKDDNDVKKKSLEKKLRSGHCSRALFWKIGFVCCGAGFLVAFTFFMDKFADVSPKLLLGIQISGFLFGLLALVPLFIGFLRGNPFNNWVLWFFSVWMVTSTAVLAVHRIHFHCIFGCYEWISSRWYASVFVSIILIGVAPLLEFCKLWLLPCFNVSRISSFYEDKHKHLEIKDMDLDKKPTFHVCATSNGWSIPGSNKTYNYIDISVGGAKETKKRYRAMLHGANKCGKFVPDHWKLRDVMAASAAAVGNDFGKVSDELGLQSSKSIFSMFGLGLGFWLTQKERNGEECCKGFLSPVYWLLFIFSLLFVVPVVIVGIEAFEYPISNSTIRLCSNSTQMNCCLPNSSTYCFSLVSIGILIAAALVGIRAFISYVSSIWASELPFSVMTDHLASDVIQVQSGIPENLYLSDGGHTENLALLPLLRCKCSHIILVDAEASEGCSTLLEALSLAREHMNVSFWMNGDNVDAVSAILDFEKRVLERESRVRRIYMEEDNDQSLPDPEFLEPINYRFEGYEGRIYYFKAMDVSYAASKMDESNVAAHSNTRGPYACCCRIGPNCGSCFCEEHPRISTANQFFNREVFQFYHAIGRTGLEKALTHWSLVPPLTPKGKEEK